MRPVKIVGTAVAVGALLAALSGCEKQEGPAEQAGEQAGEQVDEAVEHVGDQMEKAGDSIKDATTRENK